MLKPDFFLVDLQDFFFRFRVGGQKKPSENEQLSGFFFFFFFFLISPEKKQ